MPENRARENIKPSHSPKVSTKKNFFCSGSYKGWTLQVLSLKVLAYRIKSKSLLWGCMGASSTFSTHQSRSPWDYNYFFGVECACLWCGAWWGRFPNRLSSQKDGKNKKPTDVGLVCRRHFIACAGTLRVGGRGYQAHTNNFECTQKISKKTNYKLPPHHHTHILFVLGWCVRDATKFRALTSSRDIRDDREEVKSQLIFPQLLKG